jgi:hypothetical protein
MATTAAIRSQMRVALPRPAVWALLAGTLISAALGAIGGAWDVAYHRTYVVDTFFSPPHIMIYSGIAGMLILGVVIMAILAWSAQAQGGLIPAFKRQPMLALPLLANLAFLATGPFDDLWHSIFGRDKLTIWSPPHMLLLFNLMLSCASAIGLALWLRSATPRGALAPCGDRRTYRWATWCLCLGLTLAMSYLWGIPAGWEYGTKDDSTVWMTISWLCLPFVELVIALGIACAAPLLPERWWAPAAVIGLSTTIWWMLPDALLYQIGYLSGGAPILLPVGCLVYSLIRATSWPRLARSIAAALSIGAVLLVAQAAGGMSYVSPLDILIGLPLGPLAITLGERMGTALAHLMLRYASDQAPLEPIPFR